MVRTPKPPPAAPTPPRQIALELNALGAVLGLDAADSDLPDTEAEHGENRTPAPATQTRTLTGENP